MIGGQSAWSGVDAVLLCTLLSLQMMIIIGVVVVIIIIIIIGENWINSLVLYLMFS